MCRGWSWVLADANGRRQNYSYKIYICQGRYVYFLHVPGERSEDVLQEILLGFLKVLVRLSWLHTWERKSAVPSRFSRSDGHFRMHFTLPHMWTQSSVKSQCWHPDSFWNMFHLSVHYVVCSKNVLLFRRFFLLANLDWNFVNSYLVRVSLWARSVTIVPR